MKRILAVAALAAVPLLAACGSGMNHGTVTGKQVNPGYTYYIHECVSYTKYGSCRISIPMPQYMPTEYVLDLKDGQQTGTVDVDQASWDAATIGQQWPPAGAS